MHILLNSKSESDSLSNPTQVQFNLQTLTSISSTQSHLRISMFQSLTLGEIQFCICSLFLLRVAEVIHGFQPYRKPSAPPRSWRWKLECKRPFCANQTGEETRNCRNCRGSPIFSSFSSSTLVQYLFRWHPLISHPLSFSYRISCSINDLTC